MKIYQQISNDPHGVVAMVVDSKVACEVFRDRFSFFFFVRVERLNSVILNVKFCSYLPVQFCMKHTAGHNVTLNI